jgi:hypothetical protein
MKNLELYKLDNNIDSKIATLLKTNTVILMRKLNTVFLFEMDMAENALKDMLNAQTKKGIMKNQSLTNNSQKNHRLL